MLRRRTSIASYDEKIGRYGDLLPTEEGIPTLLESLSEMARSSGMKIVSIEPVEERDNKALRGQAYQAIPIRMNARAGYHELGKFFSTLENSERFIKIADMRIKTNAASPKKHDVELLVLTYILLEGK
jgi:Tfp pilus assembly protein PilO